MTNLGDDPLSLELAFLDEMNEAGAVAVSIWANAPHYRYGRHSHPYRKVLACLEGSIVLHLPGDDVELLRGTRVVVERGVAHSANVGAEGVRCAEAHFE
jgi:quercetin dioxygenase-like cupin family protein